MKKVAFLIFIGIWTFSCETEDFDTIDSNTIIVEGFLFEGQTVSSVTISRLKPFEYNENENFGVSDAEVVLLNSDQEFNMKLNNDQLGEYVIDDIDWAVNVGETYSLQVSHENNLITATTTVPPKPTGVVISETLLEIPPVESFEDVFSAINLETLEVSWDNEEARYYYFLVENIEEDPEEINQLDFNFGDGNFNLVTEPTNLDIYNLQPNVLTQYGTYMIVIYAVSQEYVDLYQTDQQDSRNLTEPLTNVKNGVGVFTSFSTDTLYFEVTKPQ